MMISKVAVNGVVVFVGGRGYGSAGDAGGGRSDHAKVFIASTGVTEDTVWNKNPIGECHCSPK